MRLEAEALHYSATDLSNFLACRHLTLLDVAQISGLVEKPHLKDTGFDALVKRGEGHEARVLQEFRQAEWSVAEITSPFQDRVAALEQTAAALDDGSDVIYQAAFLVDGRVGYPDFLVRARLLGSDGDGYEIVDAKLALTAKARAVLQATFYSRLLSETTGTEPQRLHLALGGGERAIFAVSDFAAYERQIDQLFHEHLSNGPAYPIEEPYPEPVRHCAICRWRLVCRDRRRSDDDLSLIAGISAQQRKALKEQGIRTRRAFSALEEPPELDRVGRDSLRKAHLQARIQVEGEDAEEPRHELIEPDGEDDELVPNRGLLALPPPTDGDLFFDIEGARFYSEDGKEFGLQYLFGVVDTSELDDQGRPVYRAWWAFDRAGEKRAFEELMDFLAGHLDRYPDASIYHYNHYEPTAIEHLSEHHVAREDVLRRLMGRFATREDEVDNLLRRKVFVDLYRVARQGVRASVESYSIKRLEQFFGYERAQDLQELNERIVGFDMALDAGTARDDMETQGIVQSYNEDDCRATLALRDWLEGLREELGALLGHEVPRPVPPELEEDRTPPEVKELRIALLAGLPEEEADWSDVERARALMAELLEFHRREDKPVWWRYFYLRDLNDDELFHERDAIAGLDHLEELGSEGLGAKSRSLLSLYRFPPQEHSFSPGAKVEDPVNETDFVVWDLDEGAGTLTLKRAPKAQNAPHPTALIAANQPYFTDMQRTSLQWLAQRILDLGVERWPRDPALDLLLRRRPNVGGEGPLTREVELGSARRLALALESSCLPIQGPPGSGKTHTGANQIVELVHAGRKVGVTAMSHTVIGHMLDEVADVAKKDGVEVRLGQRCKEDEPGGAKVLAGTDKLFAGNPAALQALQQGEVDVLGGTSWLWSRPEFEGVLDVLVVDEAGQLSIADVLASSRAAKSLILLGDPLQLAHPTQGSHPPIVPGSALDHYLGESATMPADLGLFIPETRRMHPSITVFTSEVFYEGRLEGMDGLEQQEVLCDGPFAGAGLRVVDVAHEGNANASPEEAEKVAEIVGSLLGCRWRNVRAEELVIAPNDVLVVTPFNAQIREISNALQAAGIEDVQVGTVDKFQGREAPVVIYSMASSSAEEAPRGMSFLYDLNRLNVATSRARCVAILVASPDLVRVFGRTPQQMQLANALCRLRERALTG